MILACDERIVFPPFELDLASGKLLREGMPVALTPKAFEILRYLAERPMRLIGKEELLNHVWPDVFVNEHALKVQVAEVRKALGDPCREPRFIETAHRRGYRFIGSKKADTPAQAEAVPPTRYARNGHVHIAYQVIGDGEVDLVYATGGVSNLDHLWKEPRFASFVRRLARHSRVILFDQRGTGLSDRVAACELAPDQLVRDVAAVMDDAGSRRAVLCGVSEGACVLAQFAAMCPTRTAGLVMVGASAKGTQDTDYPWGPTQEQALAHLDRVREQWGGPVGIERLAVSMVDDDQFRQWWSGYLRTGASPGTAVTFARMRFEKDIRSVLPLIRVPALILHRSEDLFVHVEEGRYLARQLSHARFVEMPGADHLPFLGDQVAIANEIEAFVQTCVRGMSSAAAHATAVAMSFRSVHRTKPTLLSPWRRFQDHVTRELGWFTGRQLENSEDFLVASFEQPEQAIRFTSAIAFYAGRLGVEFTAGIHTAKHEVGRPSEARAAAMARQIEERASLGQVLVSATVRDLVEGAGLLFRQKSSLTTGDSCLELLHLVNRTATARIAVA